LKTEAQRGISLVVLFYCYSNFPQTPIRCLIRLIDLTPSAAASPQRFDLCSLILPTASHATTLPVLILEIILEAYLEMDNHGINEPQNVGQDGINGRPKRRRIMTDRRREQNRQAQKNHRKYGMFLVT